MRPYSKLSVDKLNFLKPNGFPASPSDYRGAAGAEIGRPSDFPISGRSRGSAARRGAGGNLANWKPGTLGIRAARRGAGRRGPAGPPECARGAHSGGGHGLPHGPAARVPGAARDATSEGARRVLANACSTGNRSQVVGALHRGFTGCDVASAHRPMIASGLRSRSRQRFYLAIM